MFNFAEDLDFAPAAPMGASTDTPMVKLQDIIASLNPPQQEAVAHTEGPLLVLAGAGTGKTRVLTTRLANILLSGKAAPHNVMAVTFTNKAAKEMQQRVESLIGASAAGMWLGTFHGIGARMLRSHPEPLGLKQNFNIIDSDDQKRICDELLKEYNIDATQFPARLVAGIISRFKDNALTPDKLSMDDAQNINGMAKQLYAAYQARLEALNVVDFGDLLLKPLLLLKDRPDILERYQRQLKYVLVDEYQDTNAVQYLWLRLLTVAHKNLCVVGDDDQSIYGWRGAKVENILRFEKDFDNAKVVRLEQNYRSTSNILTAASSVISHNKTRHGKDLWTADKAGEKIEVHPQMSDLDEARLVADRAQEAPNENRQYADYAVLVRMAAQTRTFEEAFIKAGLPYVIVGGLKFYDRKEIRDAIAYVRLIANPSDDLAFLRIVNVPKRGLGNATLQILDNEARAHKISLIEATQRCLDGQLLAKKAASTLGLFLDMLHHWRKLAEDFTPDRLVEKILEESGYAEMLRTSKDADAKTRLENLKELIRALQDYADLTSFLEHVSLVMDGEDKNEDAVRLMTIHAAKGLEFDTVFLPGFEEGVFPHQRAMNEEGVKGVEEERRLAYVAITRAKRQLIISYAASRRMYGQFIPGTPSRFLEEIPADCLNTLAMPEAHSFAAFNPAARYAQGQNMRDGGGNFGQRPQWGSRTDKRTNLSGASAVTPATPMLAMRAEAREADALDIPHPVGARVFHQKFGYGKVMRIDGKGENARLTIKFDKAGEKTLVSGLAKLAAA